MKITQDAVALFHYALVDRKNKVLDGSRGGAPLPYLHGHQNIVPGLEKAMEGREAGDKFKITLMPSEAYGERDEELVHVIDRVSFEGMGELKVGMHCQTEDEEGNPQLVTVLEFNDEEVAVDGNHPFAGKALTFDVEVMDVRPATEDELALGRVSPG
ncbi:MAG: FKBP-type peptidyl-prolyl cis-trans isomerase [Pontibacterium sp.]